ncbi:MAG: hypothetical protein AMXMBFR56_22940 [Polyangiaceae bacterium]
MPGMSLRALGARAAVVLALLASSAAASEPTEAAAAFDEGMGHYRRKAYTEAAQAFFRAYRLEPSADAAYNAGLAWELSGKTALAATAYLVALARELEPGAAADARARVERLAPELGRIEVSAPEGARVGVPPFELEANHAVFYLEPGRHEIGVRLRDGTARVRRVDAAAGRTTVLLIEEARREAAEPSAPRPDPPRSERSSRGDYATAGWISVGVGAAAAGVAVVLGVQALGARDDFNASGHRDADARDRAERLRTFTNVAWGVAGLAAAGGVGLLLFAPSESTDVARLRPSGVALRGQF